MQQQPQQQVERPWNGLYDDDDNDVDDGILVVSTLQQKWEQFHSRTHETDGARAVASDGAGVTSQPLSGEIPVDIATFVVGKRPIDEMVGSGDDAKDWNDDDDIVLVATKPTVPSRRLQERNQRIDASSWPILVPWEMALIWAVLIVAVVGTVVVVPRITKSSTSYTKTKTRTTSSKIASPKTSRDAPKTQQSERTNGFEPENPHQRLGGTTISLSSVTPPQSTSTISTATTSDEKLRLQNDSQAGEHHSLPPQLQEEEEGTYTLLTQAPGLSSLVSSSSKSLDLSFGQPPPQPARQQTAAARHQIARQLVQDVQLVQEVLMEHRLDPSLAPQLAMSMQSSLHLVESQRHLEYHRTVVHVHQRHLDRQLSERQHQETLNAVKYDPNWREKLSFNTNVGVDRLGARVVSMWWHVFWIQQVCHGVIPLMWKHLLNSQNDMQLSLIDNSNIGGWTRVMGKMMHDMLWTLLSQLCDCQGRPSTRMMIQNTQHSSSVISFVVAWMRIMPRTLVESEVQSSPSSPTMATTEISTSSASLVIEMAKRMFFFTVFPAVEGCTCFGYCLVSTMVLIVAMLVLHQGLRFVAAPQGCHHTVNFLGLTALWGAERIVSVTVSSFLFLRPKQLPDEGDGIDGLVPLYSLLLLVSLPLWEWQSTKRLYRQVESRIAQASSTVFEAAYERGRRHLEEWSWRQRVLRYIVLSIYSAVVLRDAFLDKNVTTEAWH